MLEDVTHTPGVHRGAATWLSKGLKIEEAQLSLRRDIRLMGSKGTDLQLLALACQADRLTTELSHFFSEACTFLRYEDDDEVLSEISDGESNVEDEDMVDELRAKRPDQAKLPLPSNLGHDKCMALGASHLIKQELKLQAGQANDALHEIRLALANKAVLFRTDVQHAASHAKTTRAWGKVNAVDAVVSRHVTIYRRCQSAMMKLSADEDMMARYRPLKDEDLKVSTTVTEPNSRNHRSNKLAWFWSMDIPGDTEMNDWMSECKFHVRITADCRHYIYSLPGTLVACKSHHGAVERGGRATDGRVRMDHQLLRP